MMEPFPPHPARDRGAPAGDLRVPAWAELVARLGTAHEVRAVLEADAASGGSFSRFSADPAASCGQTVKPRKAGVNPAGLAGGKRPGDTIAPFEVDGSPAAPRETR